jgi:hypothetical protein
VLAIGGEGSAAVGVSEGGSHPGVRDDGFQAGVKDVEESGIGVAPPGANRDEVDGCEAHNGGRVTCRDL